MDNKPIRILLVEDNYGDARLIREMLTDPGGDRFALTHSAYLNEAIKHLEKTPFDVLLLDLNLQDSQGLSTFDQVYARASEVPILVLTGLDDKDLATKAVRAGAQDYLVKRQLDGNLLLRAMRYAIERKRAEEEHVTTIELFRIINTADSLRNLLKTLTSFLKNWSGCEAVGVRLRDGDDYTYFETSGFPEDFVAKENSLCALDRSGKVIRDDVGNPVLECMCGNVICGRIEPSKPYFTENGSFWTNSTTELLANSNEADRQARTRNRCNAQGYESVALIPLRSRGGPFGLLQFNDKRKGHFTPERIALLERLTNSLAMALAHRQAEEALSWEAGINAAMAELSSAVLRSASIIETSHMVHQHAERLTSSAFGYVGYIDTPTGHFVCPTLTEDVWDNCRVEGKGIIFEKFAGLCGWVLNNRRSLLTNAPADDPRSSGTPAGHVPIRRFLSAPALMGQTLVGQVAVANSDRDYVERDLKLIERLADLYAIAIQRTRADESLRKARDELELRVQKRTYELVRVNERLSEEMDDRKRLEKEVLRISESEQRRIGQDLHDGVGQVLTGISFMSKKLEQRLTEGSLPEALDAVEISRLVKQALTQTRSLAKGLCPVALESDGLMSALHQLASNAEDLFGIPCIFQCQTPVLINDNAVATHVYYIAQEAVNNAIKHGQPRHVSISLRLSDGDDIILTVKDDGGGLPDTLDKSKGMGLHIMNYRAGMIAGKLDIRRGKPSGTVVRCSFRDRNAGQ